MSDDINKNLIDKEENTQTVELKDSVALDVKNEENNDEAMDDKAVLESMGFPKELINRIYSVMHPANLEEALDYLNKNDRDKFTHSYIANNLNVCSICGYKRSDHALDDILQNMDNIEEEKEEEKKEEEKKEEEKKEEEKKEEPKIEIKDNIDVDEDSFNISDDIIEQTEKDNLRYSDDNEINNLLLKYKNRFNNKYYLDTLDIKNNDNNECRVCGDNVPSGDLYKIRLPCKHIFCVDCWKEYLKEKINNANVYKIKCMEHKCGQILQENFIKKILDKDTALLEKYDKFLKRQKILDSSKNIKFCPIPDCDGYAEKKFSKNVKCNNGHEFCFECLAAPHCCGCSKVIDSGFEEWKSHTRVKRCPNCKYYTEKNEGCNHMTCSQCKFQWCWVCEKECVAGHYEFGRCKGLHFEKVDNDEDAKRLLRENCNCCCVISWILTNFVYLLIYLFMMPCFYLAAIGIKYLDEYDNCGSMFFYFASFLPFFICYEVISTCYIVAISIPGLFICPINRCLKNILFGKILGQLFPV